MYFLSTIGGRDSRGQRRIVYTVKPRMVEDLPNSRPLLYILAGHLLDQRLRFMAHLFPVLVANDFELFKGVLLVQLLLFDT